MKSASQASFSPLHNLRFMSINVGRGGTTHDIGLARVCELHIDILLIQEPWWIGRTKSHSFFLIGTFHLVGKVCDLELSTKPEKMPEKYQHLKSSHLPSLWVITV